MAYDTATNQDSAETDDETDDEAIIEEAEEWFELCEEAEAENRKTYDEDTKFARLPRLYQWDAKVRAQRELDGRPCLTVPRLGPVIRQVVNDSRQNKPSIKVHPADDNADPETAEVMSGLIRNIEYTSDADVAYDTAVDNAVTGGWGYIRVNTRYATDDTFDQDLVIDRVANPLVVYGDPYSTAADSSDWNVALVLEAMSKKAFERKYKGSEPVDWKTGAYSGLGRPWMDDDRVIVCEFWKREEIKKQVVALSNGEIIEAGEYEDNRDAMEAEGLTIVGKPREVSSYKVTEHILTGAEVLETIAWEGKYIPITPVYGEEVWVEGKRYLKSLIGDATDAQRMLNYWRSASTELVALAPKAPWIGAVGQFNTDPNWQTANTENHSYLEYDNVPGAGAPQRQPFAGVPAGALQEALNASDDIKSITGIYDASLGARSNETSGKAIRARQMEGDISTYHFIDNLSRAIRHVGRILIDLIPKVYPEGRVIRILGEDGQPKTVKLGEPTPATDPDGAPQTDDDGQAISRIYSLGLGKYDLTVTSGPSFTTRREEAAAQMIDLIQAYPAAAPLIGDLLAKNLDWPGADEVARRLKAMLPPQINGQNPEMDQARQQLQALQQALQQGAAKMQGLEADKSIEMRRLDIEQGKLEVDQYNAETNRLKAVTTKDFPLGPDAVNQLMPVVMQAIQQLLESPDILPPEGGQEPPEPMLAPAEPQPGPLGPQGGGQALQLPPEPLGAPSPDEAAALADALEPEQQ